MSTATKKPRHDPAKAERLHSAAAAIYARTRRPPARTELAEATGFSLWVVDRYRKHLIESGRWPFGKIGQGKMVATPTHVVAARESNREKVRRAAESLFVRTGQPPTLVELSQATGLCRATVSGHRFALFEAGQWPSRIPPWGREAGEARRPRKTPSKPSKPDPDLDDLDESDIRARAWKIRELNGHLPDPRGVLV